MKTAQLNQFARVLTTLVTCVRRMAKRNKFVRKYPGNTPEITAPSAQRPYRRKSRVGTVGRSMPLTNRKSAK